MNEDEVRVGVEFLRRLGDDEIRLPELMDRIEEAVGEAPSLTREVVERAEEEGVISRREEDGVARFSIDGDGVDFEDEVRSEEGEFDCVRCGRGIKTGYFVRLGDGEGTEVGPYGSTCVRKVTGREPI